MEKRSSKIEPELKPKNTEELIKAYREVFSKSDKRGEGYVHLREVPALLKILGVRCSEQESNTNLTQYPICSETKSSKATTLPKLTSKPS